MKAFADIKIFLSSSKYPCYATGSQFLAITNRAWLLVCLYILVQTPTAVQVFRLTKLQALIPQFY